MLNVCADERASRWASSRADTLVRRPTGEREQVQAVAVAMPQLLRYEALARRQRRAYRLALEQWRERDQFLVHIAIAHRLVKLFKHRRRQFAAERHLAAHPTGYESLALRCALHERSHIHERTQLECPAAEDELVARFQFRDEAFLDLSDWFTGLET